MKSTLFAIFLAIALMPTAYGLEIELNVPDEVLYGSDIPANYKISNTESENLTNLRIEISNNGNKVFNGTINLSAGENFTGNLAIKNAVLGNNNITLKIGNETKTKTVSVVDTQLAFTRNPVFINDNTTIYVVVANSKNSTMEMNVEIFDNGVKFFNFRPVLFPKQNETRTIPYTAYQKGAHNITVKINNETKTWKELVVVSPDKEPINVSPTLLYLGLSILLILLLAVVIKKFGLFSKNTVKYKRRKR